MQPVYTSQPYPGYTNQPQQPQMMYPQPVYQQQQPGQVIIVQAAVPPPAPPAGRFEAHVSHFGAIKSCGSLLITISILGLIGAGLETAAFANYYNTYPYYPGAAYSGTYSETDYCGYWCSAILMVCGSIAVHSFGNRSDCMIVTDLISGVTGLVFAIILLALPAEELTIANDFSGMTTGSLLMASYGIMIGCGVVAMILAAAIGVIAGIAVIKGFGLINSQVDPNKPGDAVQYQQQMPAPVQPMYAQPPQPAVPQDNGQPAVQPTM